MVTAGIVVIGDEILTGKFSEENARFLIQELRSLGVELRRVIVIPDVLEEIATTAVEFSSRFDHVFSSGGVGPTHDDLTMAGIAHGFGTRVVRHPELEMRVRAYYGDKLVEANLRLAEAPEGAELVWGRDQLWPVVAYRNIYILPGVPTLFRRKFVDIRDRFRTEPMTVARVYLDCDEGALANDLNAVVAAHPNVRIGSYPRFAEKDFRVIITFEGRESAEVAAAQLMLVERCGSHVVRRDDPARVAPSTEAG